MESEVRSCACGVWECGVCTCGVWTCCVRACGVCACGVCACGVWALVTIPQRLGSPYSSMFIFSGGSRAFLLLVILRGTRNHPDIPR